MLYHISHHWVTIIMLSLFVQLKPIQASALLPSEPAIVLIDISDPLSLPSFNSGSIIRIFITHFSFLINLPVDSIVFISLNSPTFGACR